MHQRSNPAPANIAVIGTNYVGLVTAACLAQLGHSVIGIDIDPLKIARLSRGQLPIYEPGLEAIVLDQLASGRLRFSLDYTDGLRHAQFAFVCVGTPPDPEGGADLSQVRSATASLARHTPADTHLIVVNKSTLPVGTGDRMHVALAEAANEPGSNFSVVSNPEFLREGSAVADFLKPDRIVLGGSNPEAVEAVANLYQNLSGAPRILKTDVRTAEMIKYASNAFLATKISFINEMASICEGLGADVEDVALGMGLDQRIGPRFLNAGVGYGGSCFPKDVRALEHMATQAGAQPRLLRAVMDTNQAMRYLVLAKLRDQLGSLKGRSIGILGLAFKPNTDDVRESPAVEIARRLLDMGADVRAFDPIAMGPAAGVLPEVQMCRDAYAVAEDADAVLLLTDWAEFQSLDLARLRRSMRLPVLVDGRNLYAPDEMATLGFSYQGIGRRSALVADSSATPRHLSVAPQQVALLAA